MIQANFKQTGLTPRGVSGLKSFEQLHYTTLLRTHSTLLLSNSTNTASVQVRVHALSEYLLPDWKGVSDSQNFPMRLYDGFYSFFTHVNAFPFRRIFLRMGIKASNKPLRANQGFKFLMARLFFHSFFRVRYWRNDRTFAFFSLLCLHCAYKPISVPVKPFPASSLVSGGTMVNSRKASLLKA